MLEIETVPSTASLINTIYKKKSLNIQRLGDGEVESWAERESRFYLLKSEDTNQSALVLFWGCDDRLELVETKGVSFRGTTPRDAAQACMFHSLQKRRLTVVLGEAGTGKTTIALAYALDRLFKKGMKIVLCKPTVFVGMRSNAIAAIPGDHREKMSGYIDSYLTSMRRIIGDTFEHHLYELEENGQIVFQPLELIRGQQFDNAVVIIDEAQNSSPHELLSAISRLDETSTCVILGDPHQIDLKSSFDDTGLGCLVNSNAVADSDISAGITLTSNYRGPMAILASEVLKEISN